MNIGQWIEQTPRGLFEYLFHEVVVSPVPGYG